MNAQAPAAPTRTWPRNVGIFFAFGIALYALAMAALGLIPPELKASFEVRPVVFRLHMVAGAVALATGVVQLLRRRDRTHRRLGRVYGVAVAVSGAAGLTLAPFSSGGLVAHLGFGALAVAWLVTTYLAVAAARRRDFATHRAWVLRSFALTASAVTLRIYLPLLMLVTLGNWPVAYGIVAWLCWVPNLFVVQRWVVGPTTGAVDYGLPAMPAK